MNNLIQWK